MVALNLVLQVKVSLLHWPPHSSRKCSLGSRLGKGRQCKVASFVGKIFVVRPPTTKTTNILPHENYPYFMLHSRNQHYL